MFHQTTRTDRSWSTLSRPRAMPVMLAGLLVVLTPLLAVSVASAPALSGLTIGVTALTGWLYRQRRRLNDTDAATVPGNQPIWFAGFADACQETQRT